MKYLKIILLSAFLPLSAQADPAAFIGISYGFDSSFGISIKALSSDEEDEGVVAVGTTYYPFAASKKFGFDLGAGYTFDGSAIIGGWDFIQSQPQVSFGFADTDDDKKKNPPVAPLFPS